MLMPRCKQTSYSYGNRCFYPTCRVNYLREKNSTSRELFVIFYFHQFHWVFELFFNFPNASISFGNILKYFCVGTIYNKSDVDMYFMSFGFCLLGSIAIKSELNRKNRAQQFFSVVFYQQRMPK